VLREHLDGGLERQHRAGIGLGVGGRQAGSLIPAKARIADDELRVVVRREQRHSHGAARGVRDRRRQSVVCPSAVRAGHDPQGREVVGHIMRDPVGHHPTHRVAERVPAMLIDGRKRHAKAIQLRLEHELDSIDRADDERRVVL